MVVVGKFRNIRIRFNLLPILFLESVRGYVIRHVVGYLDVQLSSFFFSYIPICHIVKTCELPTHKVIEYRNRPSYIANLKSFSLFKYHYFLISLDF